MDCGELMRLVTYWARNKLNGLAMPSGERQQRLTKGIRGPKLESAPAADREIFGLLKQRGASQGDGAGKAK